jgi:glutamine amidotransferase
MQWLFEGSEEAPDLSGLGALAGRCVRLRGDVKVPHVGWNQLEVVRGGSRLLEGVPAPVFGYFAHSFAVPRTGDAVAMTTHGVPFASVVERGSMFGVQCHPEKSSDAGLAILRNFVAVVRETARAGGRGC